MTPYSAEPLEVDPWTDAFFSSVFLPLLLPRRHPHLFFPCLVWQGRVTHDGYGFADLPHGQRIYMHRYALQMATGRDLGADLYACHHCDRPACCNPLHLYIGTEEQNIRDKQERGGRRGLARAWAPFMRAPVRHRRESIWTRPVL